MLEKIASEVTDRIVCVGEEMRRKSIAARLGPPDRFEVVYSGIEMEQFLEAASSRDAWTSRTACPCWASSRGWRRTRATGTWSSGAAGGHLLFVGDGEERESIERLVAERG
jgi:hypothetical protein